MAMRPRLEAVVPVGMTDATPKPRLSASTLETELMFAAPPKVEAKSTDRPLERVPLLFSE